MCKYMFELHIHTHTLTHTHIHTYTHIHTHTYTHIHTHTHTHTHTNKHTYTHTHTHTHTQTPPEWYIQKQTLALQHRWVQKRGVLIFILKVVRRYVFLRDSGSEFQTVGPKTEKDLLLNVSREKRGTVSREVSRERSILEGQYIFFSLKGSSSSSVFPAISLGFTIFGEIFAYVTDFCFVLFFNPTIEVVTFHLHG